MNPADFELLAKLVKDRSGLILTPDKEYLLESRLMPVARKWNANDLAELATLVRNKRTEALLKDITEAMTTNESFFFRDISPFDRFRDMVLPSMMEARKDRKRIRVWCAACSSGQEPYSLAMIIKELGAKVAGWSFDIIATDLSEEMIQRAKEGYYSQFEVQRGLPVNLMLKYFKQEGDRWLISNQLKEMVSFKPYNLLDNLRPLGTFDIVFCRNVLIYFDQGTKGKVLDSVAQILAADGYLYLGGAETVIGITEKFKGVPNERGIYAPTAAVEGLKKAAG